MAKNKQRASAKQIAVFGDVHGHIRLMLQLCSRWQLDHGIHLDAVLQCGDFGYFPRPDALDKATKRFAARDPEELGFSRYFARGAARRDELVERVLAGDPSELETLRARVHWCNGNHEDFQALSRFVGTAARVTVDAFDKLEFLRSGHVHEIAGLDVAAVGGRPEAPGIGPDDYGQPEPWQWVGEAQCRKLHGEHFDVLLTHCAPATFIKGRGTVGSGRLLRLIEARQPPYAFYAHHGDPVAPATIGATTCRWLADVHFVRDGTRAGADAPVARGCMGILTWRSPTDHEFGVVDEEWFRRVNATNWRAPLG